MNLNNNFKNVFPLLARALQPTKYPDNRTPTARYSSKVGMTRPGAKHRIGKHFQPRHITQVRLNNGETIVPTPALYRRLHLGDRKKVEAMNAGS